MTAVEPGTRLAVAVTGGAAFITLDGAATRNALDRESAAALVEACEEVDADESVGVAVITGFAGAGIHPGGGHLHLLARAAGRQTAAALGMFARSLSAAGAKSAGLVWEVVPRAELDRTIAAACAPLQADPQLARAVKASLNLTTSPPDAWAAATEVDRARQMWSLTRPRPSLANQENHDREAWP